MSQQSPHRCIYCNSRKEMSKEHVIADWVAKILPRDNERITRQVWGRREQNKINVAAPFYKKSQGGVGSTKLRRVCRNCNHGWMNVIQEKAKPHLTPLFKGEWNGFSEESVAAISWSVMTAMNIQYIDSLKAGFKNGTITSEERDELRSTGTPPKNWTVWVGRCLKYPPLASSSRALFVGKEIPSRNLIIRNTHVTTIKLGSIVVHTLSLQPDRKAEVSFMYANKLGLIPIFPIWGGDVLSWQNAPILVLVQIRHIADAFSSHVMQNLGRSGH